jgi:hypothetical protein
LTQFDLWPRSCTGERTKEITDVKKSDEDKLSKMSSREEDEESGVNVNDVNSAWPRSLTTTMMKT